jgi:uncharacterized membrane protein
VQYTITLIITFTVNVPLNNQLATATTHNEAAARQHFEMRWVRWNHVRTISSTAAFGSLTWALVLHGQASPLSA